MSNQVECYSGIEYAERPRAFVWQNKRYEVGEITSQWRLPDGLGFRVTTTAGPIFELLYRTAQDRWDILPVQDAE